MSEFAGNLAYITERGFGFHAERCAPGLLTLLEPLRGKEILEIGAGTGLLTRYLVAAGHRVVATDASPAMLALCRDVPGLVDVRPVRLPDDPVPACDAVVGVGHTLNYLPDRAAIDRALVVLAQALRPGGLFALDVCGFEYGAARRDAGDLVRIEDDWALVTRFTLPTPDCFVRDMTTFVRLADGSWRREDERHDNVLLDAAELPGLLAALGVDVEVRRSFGDEALPAGLVTLIGRKRAAQHSS